MLLAVLICFDDHGGCIRWCGVPHPMQHAQGLPQCHWTSMPGECLWRIARAAAMVINVACGPMAYKTQLLAYLLRRKQIVIICYCQARLVRPLLRWYCGPRYSTKVLLYYCAATHRPRSILRNWIFPKMIGGLASSARPEQLHKISKIRILLKNYARDATPTLTSKSISIERLRAQRGVTLHPMTFG